MPKALQRAAWAVPGVSGTLVVVLMLVGSFAAFACMLVGALATVMMIVPPFDADGVPEQTGPCPSERRWELTVHTLRIFFDTWRWVGTFPPCV